MAVYDCIRLPLFTTERRILLQCLENVVCVRALLYRKNKSLSLCQTIHSPMIKQRKKGYNEINIVMVAEFCWHHPQRRTLERNMKNKEVHSGCLHGSPACDMAQMWPTA